MISHIGPPKRSRAHPHIVVAPAAAVIAHVTTAITGPRKNIAHQNIHNAAIRETMVHVSKGNSLAAYQIAFTIFARISRIVLNIGFTVVPIVASVWVSVSWILERRPLSVCACFSMFHPYTLSISLKSTGSTSFANIFPSSVIFIISASLFPIAFASIHQTGIPFSASWFTSWLMSFPFVWICPIARAALLSVSPFPHAALTASHSDFIVGNMSFAWTQNAKRRRDDFCISVALNGVTLANSWSSANNFFPFSALPSIVQKLIWSCWTWLAASNIFFHQFTTVPIASAQPIALPSLCHIGVRFQISCTTQSTFLRWSLSTSARPWASFICTLSFSHDDRSSSFPAFCIFLLSSSISLSAFARSSWAFIFTSLLSASFASSSFPSLSRDALSTLNHIVEWNMDISI